MKSIILSTVASLLITVGATAQVKEDVQQETTTKKVVVKDTRVDTKVVQEVKKNKELVMVEGNEKEDQDKKVTTIAADEVNVVTDEQSMDAENTVKVQKNVAAKNAQLEASIEAQRAEAKKERLAFDAKKRAMDQELAERRKQLEKRPKGMVKLKKDNDQ
ncbi:MAG: hypothetical protein CMC08_04850 [Flavobacteriaceae bacterium]|nr:hypothetical protein [Flavobacteriaceae bacterium]